MRKKSLYLMFLLYYLHINRYINLCMTCAAFVSAARAGTDTFNRVRIP